MPAPQRPARSSSSSRIQPAPGRKPSSRIQAVAAATPASRPSSRVSLPPAAGRRPSGQVEAAAADSAPSRRTERLAQPRRLPWIPIAIGAACVVGLGVALAWAPMQRSGMLADLDACAGDPARLNESFEIADRYLAYVGGTSPHLREAVVGNRGPLAAQIRMAENGGQADLLVLLADRAQLTPDEATAVLQAALRIWPEDKPPRLPAKLVSWAEDTASPVALVQASLALLAKAGDERGTDLAFRMADRDASADRARAGMSALIADMGGKQAGLALKLFAGRNADLAAADPDLAKAIAAQVGPAHLEALVALLDHRIEGVRRLALDALGAPNMAVVENAEAPARRESLGRRLAGRLADAPDAEVAPLARAVYRLRLSGASEAVFSALPRIAAALPAADTAKLLGESLVFDKPDAARAATRAHLDRLIATIGLPELRAHAAAAFILVKDTSFPQLRDALDRLAATRDPACIAAVGAIVEKQFVRGEVAKANGSDAVSWTRYLAKDRERLDRVRSIEAWLEENGKYNRVSDGKSKLTECRTFVKAASAEVDAWLSEPGFTPPIGLLRSNMETLSQRLHMQLKLVNQAWSGAM